MRRRDQRIERLRAVEREHRVIAVALEILRARLAADPSGLTEHGLERRDFETSVQNLAETYLIRLFAEFETGLREAWGRAFHRTTHPRTVELIEAFAARCTIPQDVYDAVDDIRKYRNALVHEEGGAVASVSIPDAGKSLRRFFSRLPARWQP